MREKDTIVPHQKAIVINDTNVTQITNKKGIKHNAQKYIYTKPIRHLYNMYKQKYPHENISYSLFYRCKPFYVLPPTAKEMEGCMCTKCLNPHKIYEGVKSVIKDLPSSLTEYLVSNFECAENKDINYPDLKCVNKECDNKCSIKNDSKKRYGWKKKIAYYVFEPVEETYFDQNGKKRMYTRTSRVDKSDTLREVIYFNH